MISRSAVLKDISETSSQSIFSGGHFSIFLLVLASLLFLSGCGGSGGSGGAGGNRELTLYQNAMAAYQTADYTGAVSLFSQELAEFPSGSYSDESQYRLGRSQQALNNFTEARTAYSLVSTTGSWVVDAAFYSARTYYDEAGMSTDPTAAFGLYDTAVTRLAAVNATYSTSGLVDQTNYYIGRTYQEQASLLKRDPSLSPTTTALQRFVDARASYDTVQTTSVFYDNALYFKGRSYHEQVPVDLANASTDYANARSNYQILISANTSNWADDAQYQFAKTYYDAASDELDPATAMAGFNTAITEFDKVLDASNRADSARYYKGRSLHKQAALVEADPTLDLGKTFGQYFVDARTAYQSVITLGVASSYEDNAQYRIGKTYYDEAVITLAVPDYPAMQQQLSDAIAAFTVVTTNTTYQTSNSADNAYYYLGRSYQRAAEIPAGNEITVAGGIDFTTVSFADARGYFEVLTGTGATAPAYPTSAWIDNAYYEIGNTWRGQVLDSTSADPLADYTAALNSYNTVLSSYKGGSREDNAARKVATVYHEIGDCSNEEAAYLYVKTLATATAISITEADTHLADLQLATPITHTCVVTLAGLPPFTTP